MSEHVCDHRCRGENGHHAWPSPDKKEPMTAPTPKPEAEWRKVNGEIWVWGDYSISRKDEGFVWWLDWWPSTVPAHYAPTIDAAKAACEEHAKGGVDA